jgi:hypothetical protein
LTALTGLLGLGGASCIEPIPKMTGIPVTGLSLRVHVFGADAVDALSTIEAARQNNPELKLVTDGTGDGELLLGLDQDTSKCVEPTGFCEYKISYRVKDSAGRVRVADSTAISVSDSSCSQLCSKALRKAVVLSIESAAKALSEPAPPEPAKPPRGEPPICKLHGTSKLSSEESDQRVTQVEALKRQGILNQREFDCLRKNLLSRI